MTLVTDMKTGKEYTYDQPPEKAVELAWRYSQGDTNWWVKNPKCPPVEYGRSYISCGSMVAKREKEDVWLREEPFTEEQLAAHRKEVLDTYPEGPDKFTCDECFMAKKCLLAFDPYNTDGDCLYEK